MMRLRKGRWFTNFFYKGKKIEVTLQTGDKRKAHINLGKVLEGLENGVDVSGSRKRIGNLSYPKQDGRGKRVWELHIQPFFEPYKIPEVTGDLIEAYIAKRWGTEAPQSTVKKELRVLRLVIQAVRPKWEMPEFEYEGRTRKRKKPLTPAIVEAVSEMLKGMEVPDTDWPAYWIMGYTGMEPMDVSQLAPCHFEDGMIDKVRSKTRHHKVNKTVIRVPVVPQLQKIIEMWPRPIDPKQPFFPDLKPKNLATNISRAFDRVLYPGLSVKELLDLRKSESEKYPRYGTKALRRFVPSQLHRAGCDLKWIRKAVGHAEDSRVTEGYIDIPDEDMKKAFAEAF